MNTITNNSTQPMKLSKGILIASILMMLFGAAEVVTSFSHQFFGLTTSQATLSTVLGAIIGMCYFSSGILFLRQTKKAAIIAIVLLLIDAIGRIAMVLTGLYPIDSSMQTFAIIVGTSIVILFAIYIRSTMRRFK